MFDGIGKAIQLAIIIVLIATPLALWKIVDVIVWIWKHVSISFN